MIREAIILAGGTGSRLRSVVSDRPKPLALVNKKPFLLYLLTYLKAQGLQHFIFALGYRHQMIQDFLAGFLQPDEYSCVVEEEPLGTGGGIRLACERAIDDHVLICNGDTFFKVDVRHLYEFHRTTGADCSLALKPMNNFDRYGSVFCAADHRISEFREKEFSTSGLINGGVYVLKRNALLNEELPRKFSFEKDYLETQVAAGGKIFGTVQDGFFIDIGVPEDYARSQNETELVSMISA